MRPFSSERSHQVHFQPHSQGTLLSGSTDGLVNIYNTAYSDEDDALVQVFNHGNSINHARFLTNAEFFALSHDECLSVYQLEKEADSATHVNSQAFGDLRAQLECEYVVDIIPLMGSEGKAVLGAGSPRSLAHFLALPLNKV